MNNKTTNGVKPAEQLTSAILPLTINRKALPSPGPERWDQIKRTSVNNETEPIPTTEWKLDNDSEISSQTKIYTSYEPASEDNGGRIVNVTITYGAVRSSELQFGDNKGKIIESA